MRKDSSSSSDKEITYEVGEEVRAENTPPPLFETETLVMEFAQESHEVGEEVGEKNTPPPLSETETLAMDFAQESHDAEKQTSYNSPLTDEQSLDQNSLLNLETTAPDANGGRHVKIKCCVNVSADAKRKIYKGFEITGYIASAAYAGFVSAIFAALTAERNKDNLGLTIAGASSSFIANAPMSFVFAINVSGFFKKLRDFGCTYRISAAVGLPLAALNTFSGLKLGIDAIFNNQYDFVQKVGIPGVAAFSFNTFSTRLIGGTELVNRLAVYAQRYIFNEWEKYAPVFTLLEDLKLYGPALNREDFKYTDSDQYSISELAENFYFALRKKGVNPLSTKWQALLKVYEKTIEGVSAFIVYSLMPMWLYIAENGLNASAKLFNSTSPWGTDMPWLTWLSALSSELFYMNFALQACDITVDAAGLPIRAGLYHPRLRGTNGKALLAAATILTVTTFAAIGYLSGGGMEKEQNVARGADYGSVGNSTFMQIPIISAPTDFLSPDYIAPLTGIAAGVLVNMGSVMLGFARRFFNSGTFVWEGDQRGVNDFIDLITKVIRSRDYDSLIKDAKDENPSVDTEVNKIAVSRVNTWKAPNFKWASLFKCNKKGEGEALLAKNKDIQNDGNSSSGSDIEPEGSVRLL